MQSPDLGTHWYDADAPVQALVDRGVLVEFPAVRPPADERRDDTTRKALIAASAAFLCLLSLIIAYAICVDVL